MLELYHADGSVCAQKVRLVIFEKGLDWVDRRMNLDAGTHYEPWYVALNPKAVVPTLVHDGKVIVESTVICEYLDDVFPDPPLRPADPYARAVMRKWAKLPDDEIHAACGAISQAGLLRQGRLANPAAYYERLAKDPNRKRAERQRRFFELGYDEPTAQAGLLTYRKMLEDMERALAAGPYLAGDTYSLADVGITPYVQRLHASGLAPMWADKPHVAGWWDRIRARSSYRDAILAFPPRYGNEPDGEGVWPEAKAALERAAREAAAA
jgi:glutathione S-transferase